MSDPDTIERAVREVRHEGLKAAAVYAVVDGVLVTLVANLVLLVSPGILPWSADPFVRTGVAVCAGLVACGVEGWFRSRRYTVERFEADNPAVETAFRTARDAAAGEATNPMASRLYDEVVDRLERASSEGFVDVRRLAVTVVLVLAVGVATVQVAATGFGVTQSTDAPATGAPDAGGGGDGGGAGGGDGSLEARGDRRLRDGGSVLGEPRNVSAGTDPLTANVSRSTGGDGPPAESYERGGGDGEEPAVATQRAGYDPGEELAKPDLVREYNRRLQEYEEDAD